MPLRSKAERFFFSRPLHPSPLSNNNSRRRSFSHTPLISTGQPPLGVRALDFCVRQSVQGRAGTLEWALVVVMFFFFFFFFFFFAFAFDFRCDAPLARTGKKLDPDEPRDLHALSLSLSLSHLSFSTHPTLSLSPPPHRSSSAASRPGSTTSTLSSSTTSSPPQSPLFGSG